MCPSTLKRRREDEAGCYVLAATPSANQLIENGGFKVVKGTFHNTKHNKNVKK